MGSAGLTLSTGRPLPPPPGRVRTMPYFKKTARRSHICQYSKIDTLSDQLRSRFLQGKSVSCPTSVACARFCCQATAEIMALAVAFETHLARNHLASLSNLIVHLTPSVKNEETTVSRSLAETKPLHSSSCCNGALRDVVLLFGLCPLSVVCQFYLQFYR